MGGTEILPVLKQVVEQRLDRDSTTTQVILLTDGEVWNTEETTDFVGRATRESNGTIRFFSLGIGYAVSHTLVEGIGRQGDGFGEVVAVDAQGRWEERVIRMLKGSLAPESWRCEITLSGHPVSGARPSNVNVTQQATAVSRYSFHRPAYIQAPYRVHSLHPFASSAIFFLFEQEPETLSHVAIKATTSSGGTVSVNIPIEHAEMGSSTIHYLTAKAIILDLETGQSWMHAETSQHDISKGRQPVSVLAAAVREEAERLGIKWSVTSKWTSFVAVDRDNQLGNVARFYKASRCELANLTRPRNITAGPNIARTGVLSDTGPVRWGGKTGAGGEPPRYSTAYDPKAQPPVIAEMGGNPVQQQSQPLLGSSAGYYDQPRASTYSPTSSGPTEMGTNQPTSPQPASSHQMSATHDGPVPMNIYEMPSAR